MRVLTYIVQVLSEDEETQRKGCVALFWPVDSRCTIGSELSHVLQVAPIRFSSFHFMLHDTLEFRKLAAWQLLALPLEWRVRTRLHFGKKKATWCRLVYIRKCMSTYVDFHQIYCFLLQVRFINVSTRSRLTAYPQVFFPSPTLEILKYRIISNGLPFVK